MKGCQVSVENVGKRFANFQALKRVSLAIKKGEFFSLLGPSGCGKTTLLRIIAGFEAPSEGDIRLDGASVLALPSNKRHVNTVFQSYALFPHLSVYENVAFPLRLKKVEKKLLRDKVEEYLNLVRLEAQRDKSPSQLSGGQKQRVAIARALINEPGVLLLDEPLSALDAKLRQHMLLELDAIHDKIGITFIYVTHDQQEAISVSDRVAVMNEGEVLQVGTPREIYETPANLFVANFIGETNLLNGVAAEIAGQLAKVKVEALGILAVERSPALAPGQTVSISVRPEKISITKAPPPEAAADVNCFKGVVDEIIYTGFQSKYFVRCAQEGVTLRVFRQHNDHLMSESAITFGDTVYVSWKADDAFIVEARRA